MILKQSGHSMTLTVGGKEVEVTNWAIDERGLSVEDVALVEMARSLPCSDLFLMYADMVEERGEVLLARAYRWCAENGKYPDGNSPIYGMGKWYWYHSHFLGDEAYRYAQVPQGIDMGLHWSFPTFSAAMIALSQKLQQAGIINVE